MNRRQWLVADTFLGLSMVLTGSRSSQAADASGSLVTEESINAPQLNRKIPIKVRWPAASFGPNRPFLVFSHGLGGTMNGGDLYGEAWAAAGMVVVHPQHTGSDAAALRASPRAAMAPDQLINRVDDVKAILDFVEAQATQNNSAAWKRVDLSKIGVSGHSFGSRTVLALAGEIFPNAPATLDLSDPRPKAFIAFSPFSSNGQLESMRSNLRKIVRPILTITGTEDGDVVSNGTTPAHRAAVFDALPNGNKAGLILKNADHFTFAGQDLPGTIGRRQRPQAAVSLQNEHLSQICQITTDWWLAQLIQDPAAIQRLTTPKIREDRGDTWAQG